MCCCCCCFISKGECVLIVSVYGVAVCVALLAVLGLHGHNFGPGFSPLTTEILHQVCLAIYTICLLANILLFFGLVVPLRPLLIPWLAAHIILCLALISAFLHYLFLYVTTDCDGSCSQLLGYAGCLVVGIIVIVYCIYLVQDFYDVLRYQGRARENSTPSSPKDPEENKSHDSSAVSKKLTPKSEKSVSFSL